MGKKKAANKDAFLDSADAQFFRKKSGELKQEADLLFGKGRPQEALETYEKALQLTPAQGDERAGIHSNRAACYLRQSRLKEAVLECNSALEAAPMYAKALLRRSKAYEMAGQWSRAMRDIDAAIKGGYTGEDAKKAKSRVKQTIADNPRGSGMGNSLRPGAMGNLANRRQPLTTAQQQQWAMQQRAAQQAQAARNEAHFIFQLTLGDETKDIKVPMSCTYNDVLRAATGAFPGEGHFALKYKDADGDMITIASRQDLHSAVTLAVKAAGEAKDRPAMPSVPPTSLTLCKVEQSPMEISESMPKKDEALTDDVVEIDEWLLEFANLFRAELGDAGVASPDLREIGLEKCCEALEGALATKEAEGILDAGAAKFQEAAAAALFNWGNVHVCRYRKRMELATASHQSEPNANQKAQVSTFTTFEKEYEQAVRRYREALDIKEDFYEAAIAFGQQAFERAKVLSTVAATKQGDAMAKLEHKADAAFALAIQQFESALTMCPKDETDDGVDGEEASKDLPLKNQILVLHGNVLFEQSQAKFRRGIKDWRKDCDAAVAKFKEANSPEADVTCALERHCSNEWKNAPRVS